MTHRRPTAFTLIEIMVVVVIVGLIAGAVSMTLASSAQKATFTSTIEQVAWMDRTTRRYCLQQARPSSLIFDPADQTVTRGDSSLHLSAATLDRIRVLGGADYLDQAVVNVTPAGRSPTYALRFTARPDRVAWLVVLGLTGQVVPMDSDQEVDDFFAAVKGAQP